MKTFLIYFVLILIFGCACNQITKTINAENRYGVDCKRIGFTGRNHLFRCENFEAVCYAVIGGISCKWKAKGIEVEE